MIILSWSCHFFFVMINFFCRANFSWPQVPLCCCTLFQPPASWQCKLNGPSWDLVCCDLLKAYTYIGLWLLWPALTSKNNAGKWFATTKWITCVVTMAHQRLTCRSQDWSGYPAGCLQLPVRFWKRTWNNHKTSMFRCFQNAMLNSFTAPAHAWASACQTTSIAIWLDRWALWEALQWYWGNRLPKRWS